ncbi:MAG: M23 family metallopeptidase [Actinobacteria bacterium]|nr:M23 family metallopeptidase [Actinomycetota bacterium]
MRDSVVRQHLAVVSVLLVVLALVAASAVLWPVAAGATSDLTSGTDALPPPELEDVVEDPVGTVEDVVEDPESLLDDPDPEPEPTAEPAGSEPDTADEPTDDGSQRAPERPTTPESTDTDTSTGTGDGSTAKASSPGEGASAPTAVEPRAPVRQPLVEAMAAGKDGTPSLGVPTAFEMGVLNDGSLPPEPDDEFLLAPLPGYWMYAEAPGPRSTSDIFELFGQALLLPSQIARLLAPFPVAGPANYSDDWGAPRHVPSYHPHAGTDIFAPYGTPVIASFDGVIGRIGRDTAIGGNSLRLVTADGTFLYYAHLAGFAPGIDEGVEVEQSDVLGFVGDSGNAAGTPPHLHFEIHPGGGGPIPPVPYLDRWLADARAAAGQYAAVSVTPLAPVVAPPASLEVAGPAGQSTPALPATPQAPVQAAPALPAGTAGASDATSPLALLILLGTAALFTLMLRGSRRPRPAVAVGAPAPALPDLALPGLPFEPLPLGDEERVPIPIPVGARSVAAREARSGRQRASFEPLPLDLVAPVPRDDERPGR